MEKEEAIAGKTAESYVCVIGSIAHPGKGW